MVRDASAYIGVVSRKYGQTPVCPKRNPRKLSITELEFNEAQRLERPILLFIMGDRHLGHEADFEANASEKKKLNAFRKRAKQMKPDSPIHRVYATFDSLEEFTSKATQAVADLRRYLDEKDASSTQPHTAAPATAAPDPIPTPPALYAEPRYIGELTKMELGEGELSLRVLIRRSDFAGHAHGLMEAFSSKCPLALLQSPFPTQTVDFADDNTVLTCLGQLLGMDKVFFTQISPPEPEHGVVKLRVAGTVGGARQIAAHGAEGLPHRFRVGPLANVNELPKAVESRAEETPIVICQSGKIGGEAEAEFVFGQLLQIEKRVGNVGQLGSHACPIGPLQSERKAGAVSGEGFLRLASSM